MSKTDKDKPYWVRLNEEATETHHRHDLFGQTRYRTRTVRDEKGTPLYNEEPIFYTVHEIVTRRNRYGMAITQEIPEDVAERANELYFYYTEWSTPLQVGVRRFVKHERVAAYTYRDYCTEGEPLPQSSRYGWDTDMPCTPTFGWWKSYKAHTRDMAGAKASYRAERNGHNRATKRALLGKMQKSWNAGEEVDDFDEEIELTAQHRHSMAWDLY